MAVLGKIGGSIACPQGTKLVWTLKDGERQKFEWQGTRDIIEPLYQSLKTSTGGVADYDSVEYDPGRGKAICTAVKVISPGDVGSTQIEDDCIIYELDTNEESIPIQSHPYFESLDSADIQEIMQEIAEYGTGSALTGKSKDLFNRLAFGAEEYIRSSYVLRETKTVSDRTLITLSYVNVNEVVTPPSPAGLSGIIKSLPAGEWLKKAPQVRQLDRTHWQIITEWWWAVKHDSCLYTGGTWLPAE